MRSDTDQIRIIEVGPRDGLQFEKKTLSTLQKIHFINSLSNTGLKNIEVASFVNPINIPQLADSEDVCLGIKKLSGISYSALVPNDIGMHRAIKADINAIAVFTAASETFCQKNIACSMHESLRRFEPVIALALQNDISVRAYISCIFACPYEGWINIDAVVMLAQKLLAMGCSEISLGDTIGIGTPNMCKRLIKVLSNMLALEQMAVHFHDTRGQALANILTCIESGIRTIDSSVAGLGGCPYAEGASGNVSTEDVIYMLHGIGMKTGVDLNKLITVGKDISRLLNRTNDSKLAGAGIPSWV